MRGVDESPLFSCPVMYRTVCSIESSKTRGRPTMDGATLLATNNWYRLPIGWCKGITRRNRVVVGPQCGIISHFSHHNADNLAALIKPLEASIARFTARHVKCKLLHGEDGPAPSRNICLHLALPPWFCAKFRTYKSSEGTHNVALVASFCVSVAICALAALKISIPFFTGLGKVSISQNGRAPSPRCKVVLPCCKWWGHHPRFTPSRQDNRACLRSPVGIEKHQEKHQEKQEEKSSLRDQLGEKQ